MASLPLFQTDPSVERRVASASSFGTEAQTSAAAARDWRWQLRHAATTTEQLAQHLVLTASERQACREAERAGFPISVTPYYLSLCHPSDASCPIRRQVVPALPAPTSEDQ